MPVPRRIDWPRELPMFWAAADGAAPVFCFLVALRCCENGGRGNEFGVLSIRSADTLEEELEVALTSLANHQARVKRYGDRVVPIRGADGYFTDAFLRDFSQRWAPIGAGNDPTNLNSHHATNLCRLYAAARVQLAELVAQLRV